MCIRYSIDGREWWDSNDGLNYSFTFAKASPKRPTRISGPAAFGGGFMRLQDAASSSLPGVRVKRSVSPASKIKSDLGVSDAAKPATPRSWIFPKLQTRLSDGPPSGAESPALSPPPPASFFAPSLPDVHTHLSLSKYCAPSLLQSPPKEQSAVTTVPVQPAPLILATELDPMNSFGGPHATLSPEAVSVGHERRSSWSGETGSWDSFSTEMERVEPEAALTSTDGETTPVASGSRSPTIDRSSSSDSSPEHRPLSLKRSIGDLRSLLTDGTGLITPPSSTSSPPSPTPRNLPVEPMSSPSVASTGESSPVHTVSSDSNLELSNLSINWEPEERGRSMTPMGYKMLSHSYQKFASSYPERRAKLTSISSTSAASSNHLR